MIFNNFDESAVNSILNLWKDGNHSILATRLSTYNNGKIPDNFDEFCKSYSKTLATMSKRRMKAMMIDFTIYRNIYESMRFLNYTDNNNAEYNLDILNKLIGDHKIHKKMQRVYDGSFLANRIWMDDHLSTKDSLTIEMTSPEVSDSDREKFKHLCSADKIDWLYNHFDTIFIQLKPCRL